MHKEVKHTPPPLADGCLTFIDQMLNKESLVLLTGCRSGTAWLAKRAKLVVAYEHDPFYCGALRAALKREGIMNVHVVMASEYGTHGPRIDGPIMFDLVLVNGIGRTRTVLTVAERVKRGGYLVLDNSQSPKLKGARWYLGSLGWPSLCWLNGPRRTRIWLNDAGGLIPQTNTLVH